MVVYYKAAALAYTTSYSFSIPKVALHMDQQTALSDFCWPPAPGQANLNKTISCNIVCIAKHSHYAISPRSSRSHTSKINYHFALFCAIARPPAGRDKE